MLPIPVNINTKSCDIPFSQNAEDSNISNNNEIFIPINDPRPIKQQKLFNLATNLRIPKNPTKSLKKKLYYYYIFIFKTFGIEEEHKNLFSILRKKNI